MLRYSLGQEYVETRAASSEERDHVQVLLRTAEKRVSKLRSFLYVGGLILLLGSTVMFFPSITGIGFLLVMLDFIIMPRIVLAYRDANRPIPLLRRSSQLTEVAVYGDPRGERSSVLHPKTGLLISKAGALVDAVIEVEGVDSTEQQSYPNAAWYPPSRQFDGGLDRRPLSRSELSELKFLRSQIPFRTSGLSLIAIWVFVGGVASVFDRKADLPPAVPWLCGLGLIGVIGIHIYRNIPFFHFWFDRKVGQVVRVDSKGRRIEFLPHSRIVWTEDDEPSELRRDGMLMIYEFNRPKTGNPRSK